MKYDNHWISRVFYGLIGVSVFINWMSLACLPMIAFSETNYDEANVPPYELPDPLVCFDGIHVNDAALWRTIRRAELLEAFITNMYGRVVELPPLNLRSEVRETGSQWGGLATRKQVTLHLFDDVDAPKIDLLLYVPNNVPKPVPAFLRMSYGNQGVNYDYNIIPSRNTITKVGQYATGWPFEMILKRGYAVVTFAGADIEQDRHGSGTDCRVGAWREGIRGYALAKAGRVELASDEWGTIAAWAWGMSRALDYLESDPDIDECKVIALGHSRTGKAALWAAAQDERFAIAISNNSGEGGAALTRRIFGETIETLPAIWFAPVYKSFAGREASLPFDQHLLISLIAPRAVYVASATEDLWTDPKGEFLAVLNAEPVYELLGRVGLGIHDMPQPDQSVGETLGYHVRTGEHAIKVYDWQHYLDFVDRHFQTGLPAVSNVTIKQVEYTRQMLITYDLNGDSIVTLSIETNGVAIPDSAVTRLTGDVSKKITSGAGKSIIWNAGADWPENVTENAKARVAAWSTNAPPPVMVIDLSKGTAASQQSPYPVYYYTSMAALPGGGLSNDVYKTDMLVMSKTPAGSFTLSDGAASGASVSVDLTQSFYAGIYEVSQKQWFKVMGTDPAQFKSPSCPVEKVSYDSVRGSTAQGAGHQWPLNDSVYFDSFIGRLRSKTGLSGFDLPTEAQWEAACRAGTSTYFNDGLPGSSAAQLNELGWYNGNSEAKTHTVGLKAPNASNLYDMHGNVYELCLDWHADTLSGGTDPVGPSDGTKRVLKGGSYNHASNVCRSAARANFGTAESGQTVGFRLFNTLP